MGINGIKGMITIDTTNMCSHLQRKLFEEDGIYHSLWIAVQDDPELTAVVRSRQLHIYRNGQKVLVLAGKSAPKVIREDSICELLQIERIKWMEQRFNNALADIKDDSAALLKAIKEDVAELSKYYGSELWKLDFAADEAGNLPPDLKRGVLSEDGIWNLLSDYREKIKYSAIFFLCWFALFGLTGGWSPEVPNSSMVMDLQGFFISLLNVVCEMAPYLLLGFFIAGVLHVFVPQKFYANYLSRNNKFSVLWAALLGIPLPLCSCGVIPTAIGLRNEKASKGKEPLPRFSLPRRRRASIPFWPRSR